MLYEIMPNLYLTNYEGAKKAPTGALIINCTRDLPPVEVEAVHVRVPVDDDGGSGDVMLRYLDATVRAMDDALSKNQPVVVHCRAGQQRSATVVCAYVMRKLGYSKESAIAYVRGRKPDAFFWSVNFDDTLQHFH